LGLGAISGVGDFDLDRVAREFWLGADEQEAPLLADRAAAAVATHEKARAKALFARADTDFILRNLEPVDTAAALDLDADGECVRGEDALEMLHLSPQLGVVGAGESVRPPRRIDVAVVELDAREVAGRPAEL
jgi:hypothetical protein